MRSLLVISLLLLMDSSSRAEGIPVTATIGASGLKALVAAGNDYIDNGQPSVDGVVLLDVGGKSTQGSTATKSATETKSNTVSLAYDWGTISYRYSPKPNGIGIIITVHNVSQQTITELRLTPLTLRLPAASVEYNGNTPLLVNSIGAPAVTTLTASGVRLCLVDEDIQRPLLLGFPWALNKPANTRFPLRLTVGRDNMYPDSLPVIHRSIPPGGTDDFQLSLRFAKAGDAPEEIAKDIYRKFASTFPSTIKWPDRRPIASLIIGTANAGWPGNPRGWFLDSKLEVLSAQGYERFRARLLQWADESIAVMRSMNAQGMITWDIEGEQFAHPTTYIGDPRAVDQLAPEMTQAVDEYFKKFRAAGFRVGVTIRPQQLSTSGAGYIQKQVPDVERLLIDKIQYAKTRWGASIFYVDSNGDSNAPIDAAVFEAVSRAIPGILLIPEQKTMRYAATTAPYYELRKSIPSTPPVVRRFYPEAFSVINTADGDIGKYRQQLADAVAHGDILLFRGWFNDSPNQEVLRLSRSRR